MSVAPGASAGVGREPSRVLGEMAMVLRDPAALHFLLHQASFWGHDGVGQPPVCLGRVSASTTASRLALVCSRPACHVCCALSVHVGGAAPHSWLQLARAARCACEQR